ncbi:aldo/keto reductase [Dactylosporangium sp. AC04546]|uniref:aldo/keto reductase n=1 Tax=Dactylosporangium sp. AC04546 TaxID=2862460 RepID=UPI001EDE675C|nr:aldo/keto reductase [Dactylosporangium sp. AC04546]WVK89418.1 aldo/keto reductase [Dactylosporangium sp. AC04546]
MRYRRLGRSGLTVSVVGIGCNNFGGRIDADRANEVVNAALELGVTLFDTADVYGNAPGDSERVLGAALGSRRDEVIVATKFGMDVRGAYGPDWGARGGRRYIARAVESSLRNLGTDYIDLYQLHAPDPATPIEETLDALDDLVRAGKVRYIGHSNFTGWQTADAAWTAETRHVTPFVSAQNRYSMLHRAPEQDLVPALEKFGLGLLPYFPLAMGLLTGKYRRGESAPVGSRLDRVGFAKVLAEAPWDTIERIEGFAQERGVDVLTLAIGGLAAMPSVSSVIAGATTAEQVKANVAAGSWEPTADDLAALNDVLNNA